MCVCVCMYVWVCVCVPMFETPWTVVRQASLSMEFSRQEYWSGLHFCNLPDPGVEPRSPTLQADSLLSEPPGKHICLLSGFIWKLEFITFTDNFDSGFYK